LSFHNPAQTQGLLIESPTTTHPSSPTNIIPPLPTTTNILCRDFRKSGDYMANMQSNNPFRRVLYTILYLCNLIKRVPKFDEFYELYKKMGLYTGGHSGQEIDKRKDRYNKAVRLVEKDFDISKCRGDYVFGDCDKNIRKDIDIEVMDRLSKKAGYRYKITYGDLNIGLGYHVLCVKNNLKPNKEFTAPICGMIELFRRLKELKIYHRSCDRGKVKAIREILVHMKYIELLDGNYVHTINRHEGIAKKWIMAPGYPKYKEIMLLREDLVTQIKKSMHVKTLEFLRS